MNSSLPSTWRYTKLGKCCTVVSGATPRRNVPAYWRNDIPWVTPKDLSNLEGPILKDAPEYISKEGYRSCSTTILPKGSILFSSRAPIGLVSIAGRDMCTNQGFKSLIPGRDVHSSYLYHCMKWLAPKIADMGNGATFKEVSREIVSRVEIPLPSLPEQKRIAAILDKADVIRRKRQQAIKLADEFLRSVFLDVFGDPVTNPKAWPLRDLKELVKEGDKINYGVVQPGPDYPDGVPIIRVGDLLNGTINKESLKRIDPKIDLRHKKSKLFGDEILIACVGSIGKIALADKSLAKCNIARAVARIRPGKRISKAYLSMFLGTPFIQSYFQRETRTVSQPTLNISLIENAPVLIPSKKTQKLFDTFYYQKEAFQEKQVILNAQNDELLNSLTQGAFRGEL